MSDFIFITRWLFHQWKKQNMSDPTLTFVSCYPHVAAFSPIFRQGVFYYPVITKFFIPTISNAKHSMVEGRVMAGRIVVNAFLVEIKWHWKSVDVSFNWTKLQSFFQCVFATESNKSKNLHFTARNFATATISYFRFVWIIDSFPNSVFNHIVVRHHCITTLAAAVSDRTVNNFLLWKT